MGSSRWDPTDYMDRQTTRSATGQSAFAYSQAVSSGQVARAVHEKMNPFGVMREARDSVDHPETVPVAVFFDVTGSMGSIPVALQKKLGQLMETLVGNGYLAHPAILFGAIGDAYRDVAPLQVGQFESGIELDDDLSRIWLEGGGGGNGGESYAMAAYFTATQTSTDAWEKRGKKGYLFTMGDEPVHDLTAKELSAFLGANVECGMTAKEAYELASQRYEVFHIVLGKGSSNSHVMSQWKGILGERAIYLDDYEAVTETIASTIGLLEGAVNLGSLETSLVVAGADQRAAASASRAVTILGTGTSAVTKATADGSLGVFGSVSGGITKL